MTTVTETTDAPSDTVTRFSIEVGDTFLGEFSSYNDTDWIRTTLRGSDGYGYYASLQGDVWQLNLTLWSGAPFGPQAELSPPLRPEIALNPSTR
jgi:hypothetical protein